MRPLFPPACLAVLVSLVACHRMSWSPQQIDDVYASCQPRSGGGPGALPLKPSEVLGLRTPADPPGTPVVMYGASWCGACHVAAQYMTRRGIPFVEKDIEEDPSAQSALDATLAAAKFEPKPRHGLPVMDVRGTVMVGFVPCLVERAWAAP